VIDGTPENVRALVRAGDSIVVFPGGAREVFKRRGEKYTLLWGTGAALRASRSRTGIRSCRSRSLAPRTSTISCSMRRTSWPRRSARCSGGSHRTPTSSRPSFADSGRRRCPGSSACTSTSPPRWKPGTLRGASAIRPSVSRSGNASVRRSRRRSRSSSSHASAIPIARSSAARPARARARDRGRHISITKGRITGRRSSRLK
jgi:hypothetical protein